MAIVQLLLTKNEEKKNHEVKIIRQLPWFFHLRDGEFISQEISSLRLSLEKKLIKNKVAFSIFKI